MKKYFLSAFLLLCGMTGYTADLYLFDKADFLSGYSSVIEGITRVEFASDGMYAVKDGQRIAVPMENLKHFCFYCDSETSVQAPELKTQCEISGEMLNVSAAYKVDNISVYTVGGIVMRNVSPNSTTASISLKDMNKGVYIVRISTGHEVITKKIVK